jgi:DNA-binding NtrC family response regulator
VGTGTRFTVVLKLDEVFQIRAAQEQPAPVFPSTPNRQGGHVLIVEDEVVIRRLLKEILCTRLGCTVELVFNGVEALEALNRSSFSLILSDVRMPLMNGKDFYQRLLEQQPELSRRFVFITGHEGGKNLGTDIGSCNVPVIAKPFTFERLAEVCGPILRDSLRSCA